MALRTSYNANPDLTFNTVATITAFTRGPDLFPNLDLVWQPQFHVHMNVTPLQVLDQR